MLPFFAELVAQTDESRRRFETHPVVLEAVANGMSIERYRTLLLELYQLVWHFNPTCAAAASRMQDEFAKIRYFLYEHMQEESGHEQWVANDLDAVGVAPSTIVVYKPSVQVLALVGYNYWAAERRHPCSILGMMYVLEVIASVYGGPFTAAIKEALLLEGERGVSFINSHASMDTLHMAELRQVLNLIEGESARHAIVEAVDVNFQQVTQVFAAV